MDDLESLAKASIVSALQRQLPEHFVIDGETTMLQLDGRSFLIEVSCFDITEQGE